MKILDIKEHKDGSATLVYEITEVEKTLLKRVYKRKRFTPNLLRKALIDAVNQRKNREENRNN